MPLTEEATEEDVPVTERAMTTNEEALVAENGTLQEQLRRLNTILTSIVKTAGEIIVNEGTLGSIDGRDEVHAESVITATGTVTRYWHERVGE